MKSVISFDVGIKNLAYCIMDNDLITKWDVVDIGGKTLDDVSDNLIQLLDDMMLTNDFQELTVLIENQPVMKNPTMKSIQMIIYSYFRILHVHREYTIDVHHVSAMRKNKYMTTKGYDIKKKDYKSNKLNSILCVQDWLKSKSFEHWETHLQARKKKDDLCDCLIQIISYFDI
jgi:hypothetical protein